MRPIAYSLVAALVLSSAPGLASAQAAGTPLGNFFACEASGQRQETGALLGGVAGALLGSQVSKNERALGAVVGAGLGAVAGSWIGCRMQVSEQQRVVNAVETALNTNQSQTWNDPTTGTTGRVDIINANYGGGASAGATFGQPTSAANLRFSGRAQPLRTSFEPTNAQYTTRNTVNLRASPAANAAVVGQLRGGQSFNVVGRVAGDRWLLVEQNGYVTGYVAEWVVQPVASGGGYASVNCKLVQQTIQPRMGRATTERYTACPDAGGGWRLSAA
ncbi:MAG: SH3 domain-containing protein [Phenylobacterium sp.]|nr:SH3 domain-containing protein [Phenylobacterium sp.]